MPLVLRGDKGSALTFEEMDDNFTYLEELIDGGLRSDIIANESDVEGETVTDALNTLNEGFDEVVSSTVPLGTIMHFPVTTPPDGWLVADGSAVTPLYPDLRTLLIGAGSPFGVSGDDPRLPDLRGEFIRGWDDNREVDSGRVFGSSQGDAVQDHSHLSGATVIQTLAGQATNARFGTVPRVGTANTRDANGGTGDGTTSMSITSGVVENDTITPPGAGVQPTNYSPVSSASVALETRPRNIALLPCIKAFGAVSIEGMADLAEIFDEIAAKAAQTLASAEAYADAHMIGVGQTWQDVTSARATGTAYQNTTGRPIFVSVYSFGNNSSASSTFRLAVSDDGSSWQTAAFGQTAQYNDQFNLFTVVDDAQYYRFERVTGVNTAWGVTSWLELR